MGQPAQSYADALRLRRMPWWERGSGAGGQGPGLGQGGSVHLAEKYAASSGPNSTGVLPGPQRWSWRSGRLRTDPPDRGACSAAPPALASGPHASPASGTPAPGTTAQTQPRHSRSPTSGCRCRGNGGAGPWLRRRKGQGHRPPQEQSRPCRPPPPPPATTHGAHSLCRRSPQDSRS